MEKLVTQIKRLATLELTGYWPKDWVLRLLALLFAIFLWYFVVGEDKVDTHLLVPVELVNLPRDLVIANQVKQQLEVTISGPRGLIDGLRRQPVSRSVNLAEAKPGTMVFRNDPETLPFPRGIEVLRVQPAHTTVLIDRLKEKQLPVQAEISGEPAAGFELVSVELEPPTIQLRGPEALLNQITLLRTMPVDIGGLNAAAILQAPLLLSQELIELLGEVTVNVVVLIREKTGEISLSNLNPVLLGRQENLEYLLSPKTIQVRLLAPLSRHRDPAALAAGLQITLDVSELEPGQHELVPQITTGEFSKVVTIRPEKIGLNIKPGK